MGRLTGVSTRSMVHPAAKLPKAGTIYTPFPIFDFSGGLNNKFAPERIADNQSPDMLNVNFDQLPAIQSRSGYTALNSTKIDGNAITTIMSYNKYNGSKYLLATSGTSVYLWKNNAWTALTTTLTGNGQRFSYQVFKDNLYMVNGVDGLMKFDGTTFSTVSGAPNGKYIKLYKNYMFIAGDPNNPSFLYYSNMLDPETWPSLDVVNEATNDGDVIKGLSVFRDILIVFKERSKFLFKGAGPAYWVNTGPVGTGTVSDRTVVAIPSYEESGFKRNMLLFLARDGVYAFDGSADHLISNPIQGSVNQWNQQFLNGACAVDYKHKYWLSVPEGTVTANTRTYIFDYTCLAWTRYSIAASCFAVYQDPTTLTPQLYSGDTTQGIVYQQDVGSTDNGASIDAYYWTKNFDFGVPSNFKRYKQLFAYAPTELQNYTLSLTYNVDFGKSVNTVQLPLQEATNNWGSMQWGQTWGGAANIATKTTNVPGMGRYIAFKIENASTQQQWAFYGIVIQYLVTQRMV